MKFYGKVLLISLCLCTLGHAKEFNVTYKDKTYYLYAEFEVAASPERVMEVLTDFEHIADLNPAIIESEIQTSPNNIGLRVRTVIEDCVLFFCKKITRVEDITQHKNTKLEALIIPMISDLRSGYATWELTQQPTGTFVKYDAHMQPKFWIPPIIRSYVLTKKFTKRVKESVELLQIKAQQNEQ